MTAHVFSWIDQDPIAHHAASRPDHVACVSLVTGDRFTYEQLNSEVARCASFLRSVIAEPRGARIAFMGRNSIRTIELFYACARIGAIFVPLNYRLSGAELKKLIDDADPSILIFDSEFYPQAKQASGGTETRRMLPISPWYDYVALAMSGLKPDETVAIDADAPWCLLYTSGTTGRPKGVIVTAHTAFHSAANFHHLSCVSGDSVSLCNIPLFHVAGLLAVLHTTLVAGATVLIIDRFFPDETLKQLSDRSLGITHGFLTPHMAKLLRREPSFEHTDLSHLSSICSGGGPLPPSLVQDFLARGVLLTDGYGSTEAGTIMGMPLDAALTKAKPGSCGIPGPGVEVRLVGSDGADVAEGEIGEIRVRGPAVTPGYWNQPMATADAFCDGWLRTGDAARRDADEFYYIVGRCKDMYISGGEKVYPPEVENVLADIESVADVAVIGVPDQRLGEVGVAYLVVTPGASVMVEDVIAWCNETLARYKHPRHVKFVPEIPRTATGKVNKDMLRLNWAYEQDGGGLDFALPA